MFTGPWRPPLKVYQSDGTMIATNDNWGIKPQRSATTSPVTKSVALVEAYEVQLSN